MRFCFYTEKKITFHDQSFNPEHMDGWKVSRLAMQFDELVSWKVADETRSSVAGVKVEVVAER